MIQKIKQLIFVTLASSSLLTFGLASLTVSTVSANNITSSVCTGTNNAAGSSATNDTTNNTCGDAGSGSDDSLSNLASKVVNIFSLVVGITAVIMIIYGGFRYITSGGDSGRVGSAKSSLLYAIIGLVIVALAQFIVHYVLNTASTVGGGNGA